MSKEAALRAMREANYARRAAGTTPTVRQAKPAVRPAKPKAATRAAKATPAAPASTSDELCGHRSMNGRSCTREQGHAAKSHRYS
jgi:hypothetical protein